MSAGRLAGRVAIITGGGRGIGREEALLFAKEGAKVVVNDLGTEWTGHGSSHGPAEDVVGEIRAAGGQAIANADDISDWEGSRRLIDLAVTEFGALDILVCNAGILRNHMLTNMTEDEWDDVIRVNLKGHFCPARWAAIYWRDHGLAPGELETSPRRLIFTSSGAGLNGASPGVSNYVASKAGILGLGVSLSKELARFGVTVNTLCPRALTRLSTNVLGADQFEKHPPEDAAAWAVYLCTDAARAVSGQVFSVGGESIERVEGWHTVAKAVRKSGSGLTGCEGAAAAVVAAGS
jgi:NAD(P)-dependent dehydrogenase (short-subunit alcohol dehydrogenase family)